MEKKEKRLILLSAAFFVIASIFSSGFYYPDEHFQILEFAGLKLGMTTADRLPWEFAEKMRPAIQPAMVFVLVKIFSFIGIKNPFITTFVLRLISGFLFFTTTVFVYRFFRPRLKDSGLLGLFVIASFFSWFVVYHGVRFSSETWSGSFFMIGFLYFHYLDKKIGNKSIYGFFLLGIILGFSFLFRYQVGFLIFGFLFWSLVVKKEKFINLFAVGLGILTVIAFGILIDRWFYDSWALTTWNYFEQNIVQKKAEKFGVSPWWLYLNDFFVKVGPPYSLLFLLSLPVFILVNRKDPITWSILPFIAIHMVISHKELRFLVPMIFFLPFILVSTMETIQRKVNFIFEEKLFYRFFIKASLFVNFLILVYISFVPAYDRMPMFSLLYHNYPEDTILYYYHESPYRPAGLYFDFYKRKNMNTIEIKNPGEINCKEGAKKLIISSGDIQDLPDVKFKLIFRTLPEWILKFNFNHWADRTVIWRVYEIKECNTVR